MLCCGAQSQLVRRVWTRIGQTKEVKVYRLITSKTYERQMFERTSKKLGLDQAVLDNINITDIANTKTKKETLAQVGLTAAFYDSFLCLLFLMIMITVLFSLCCSLTYAPLLLCSLCPVARRGAARACVVGGQGDQ